MSMRYSPAVVVILFACRLTNSHAGALASGPQPGSTSAIRGELEAITKAKEREWTAYIKVLDQAEEMKKNGALPEAVVLAQEQA